MTQQLEEWSRTEGGGLHGIREASEGGLKGKHRDSEDFKLLGSEWLTAD